MGAPMRDKDFEWYRRQLEDRLGPLQQSAGGAAYDFSHVVRAFGDEFARELSDPGLAETLEDAQARTGHVWRAFRGKLRAEQAKRRVEADKSSLSISKWTLAAAVAAAFLGLLALVI